MATLKSDLDDYLLQNDNRRGFRIQMPSFSTPSFMSRNSEQTPTNDTTSWFENVQKEYCTLTRTQRFMCFGACVFLGIVCFIISFIYIPFLILKARKFALLFTLGSFFFLLSSSFLYGPWSHLKSLFSKERALSTIFYTVTLVATLYCALHLQSTVLTIIFAVLQVIALIWMLLGSIPGGASGARFFGSMFKSSVSNTLPI